MRCCGGLGRVPSASAREPSVLCRSRRDVAGRPDLICGVGWKHCCGDCSRRCRASACEGGRPQLWRSQYRSWEPKQREDSSIQCIIAGNAAACDAGINISTLDQIRRLLCTMCGRFVPAKPLRRLHTLRVRSDCRRCFSGNVVQPLLDRTIRGWIPYCVC